MAAAVTGAAAQAVIAEEAATGAAAPVEDTAGAAVPEAEDNIIKKK